MASNHENKEDKYNERIDNPDKINRKYFPSKFDTKILYKDPYIIRLKHFLTKEEIKEIRRMAHGKFERSTIVVEDEMVKSNVRTSETAFITDNGHFNKYSKPIENILNKVKYLTGCKRNQIESLMVVKYSVGQEYYNHHDYFKPGHTETISYGGQRIGSFFIYLNSLEEDAGGETEFPLIKVKSRPSEGDAVFWWNMKPSGKLLKKTLHRGNPVKKGIKYGLNLWTRSKGWSVVT